MKEGFGNGDSKLLIINKGGVVFGPGPDQVTVLGLVIKDCGRFENISFDDKRSIVMVACSGHRAHIIPQIFNQIFFCPAARRSRYLRDVVARGSWQGCP